MNVQLAGAVQIVASSPDIPRTGRMWYICIMYMRMERARGTRLYTRTPDLTARAQVTRNVVCARTVRTLP